MSPFVSVIAGSKSDEAFLQPAFSTFKDSQSPTSSGSFRHIGTPNASSSTLKKRTNGRLTLSCRSRIQCCTPWSRGSQDTSPRPRHTRASGSTPGH